MTRVRLSTIALMLTACPPDQGDTSNGTPTTADTSGTTSVTTAVTTTDVPTETGGMDGVRVRECPAELPCPYFEICPDDVAQPACLGAAASDPLCVWPFLRDGAVVDLNLIARDAVQTYANHLYLPAGDAERTVYHSRLDLEDDGITETRCTLTAAAFFQACIDAPSPPCYDVDAWVSACTPVTLIQCPAP